MDTLKEVEVKGAFRRFLKSVVFILCFFIAFLVLFASGMALGQRETPRGSENTAYVLTGQNNGGSAGSDGKDGREADAQDEDDESVLYSIFARQGLKVIIVDSVNEEDAAVEEDTVSVGQDGLKMKEIQPIQSVEEVKWINPI